uniref:Uncharacterized protein n=1 Tax=Solanum lycopersicum TaxID=4081 RepID=A0A3Q7GIA7_SOLLC
MRIRGDVILLSSPPLFRVSIVALLHSLSASTSSCSSSLLQRCRSSGQQIRLASHQEPTTPNSSSRLLKKVHFPAAHAGYRPDYFYYGCVSFDVRNFTLVAMNLHAARITSINVHVKDYVCVVTQQKAPVNVYIWCKLFALFYGREKTTELSSSILSSYRDIKEEKSIRI